MQPSELFREILDQLWAVYCERVPYVKEVATAISARDDRWVEDHIAFRTLPVKGHDLLALTQLFEHFGYRKMDTYQFEGKKLNAVWLAPPAVDDSPMVSVLPKIFVSELDASAFSPKVQAILKQCTKNAVPQGFDETYQLLEAPAANAALIVDHVTALLSAPPWPAPTYRDFETVRQETEYGAWTLAFGPIPNHFTVSIHLMSGFNSITEFVHFVEDELSIPLNRPNGRAVQGNPSCMLEQFSTLAAKRSVAFEDGIREIPYAFIEFAYRHTLPGKVADGTWGAYYQGFVSDNADKIFESTHVQGEATESPSLDQ